MTQPPASRQSPRRESEHASSQKLSPSGRRPAPSPRAPLDSETKRCSFSAAGAASAFVSRCAQIWSIWRPLSPRSASETTDCVAVGAMWGDDHVVACWRSAGGIAGRPCDCGDPDAAVRWLGDPAEHGRVACDRAGCRRSWWCVTVSVSRPSSGEPIAQRLNAIHHLCSRWLSLTPGIVGRRATPVPGCGRIAGRGQPRPQLPLVAGASTPPPSHLRLMRL